ncbi:MAG: DUF3798 domain-containing protein [Clostridiales bacterium]|nr:DUF3798 domain-containing protein [Clostridiales bacterium]
MIKKILSFVLIIAVIFALSACGKNNAEGKKLGYNVGIIYGPKDLFPETAAAVEVIKAEYGDEITAAGFPTDYQKDSGRAIESVAKALVLEAKVQAVVFAKSVAGTAQAVETIKSIAPDIPVICCDTDEAIKDLAKADAVINPDMTAMGGLAVDQAKKAGASKFCYYSFQRNNGYENNTALRAAVEAGCKDKGIEFIYVNSVDPLDENGPVNAGKFIIEDTARKAQDKKEGQVYATLSTDPAVYGSIVKSALMYKNALVPQGHGASFSGLIEGLEIDMTGNEGKNDYVIERSKALLADISGKASVPAVSLPEFILKTAVGCAAKAVSDKNTALDEDTVSKEAQKFAAADKFSLNKGEAANLFTVSTSVIEF